MSSTSSDSAISNTSFLYQQNGALPPQQNGGVKQEISATMEKVSSWLNSGKVYKIYFTYFNSHCFEIIIFCLMLTFVLQFITASQIITAKDQKPDINQININGNLNHQNSSTNVKIVFNTFNIFSVLN